MTISLPADWNEVSIAQFQAIQEIFDAKADDYSTNVALISILSGEDIDRIQSLSLKSYANVLKVLDFLKTPIRGEVQKVIKVNGKPYDVITDVYKLNGGQYITLMHILKNDNTIKQLHEVMAIFCVPRVRTWYGWKKGKYQPDKHQEVAKEMLSATMDMVHPLSAFFFSNYLKSVERILESSVRSAMRIKRQAEKRLARIKPNTDG